MQEIKEYLLNRKNNLITSILNTISMLSDITDEKDIAFKPSIDSIKNDREEIKKIDSMLNILDIHIAMSNV